MLEQLLDLLDRYGALVVAVATAVVAIATAVYVGLTRRLLGEAQASREAGFRAAVEAYPRLYGPHGILLALQLENFGPANAADVELVYRITNPVSRGSSQRHARPLLGRGQHVLVLPDRASSATLGSSFAQLAETGLSLEVEWRWKDALGEPHSRSFVASFAELHRDLYGGITLGQPTTDDSLVLIADRLEKVSLALAELVDFAGDESHARRLDRAAKAAGRDSTTDIDSQSSPEPPQRSKPASQRTTEGGEKRATRARR